MRQAMEDLPVAMEQPDYSMLSAGSWGGMVMEYLEYADVSNEVVRGGMCSTCRRCTPGGWKPVPPCSSSALRRSPRSSRITSPR